MVQEAGIRGEKERTEARRDTTEAAVLPERRAASGRAFFFPLKGESTCCSFKIYFNFLPLL